MQQPGQRDGRHRHPARLRHRAHRRHRARRQRLVGCGKIELGPAPFAADRAIGAKIILAGQQAARERAPHHQAKAFGLHHRHQFPLQIAAGHGIKGLIGCELVPPAPFSHAQRLGNLPRRPVRHPDIARAPGPHDILQRTQAFFHRAMGIPAVDLVKIDMIQTQPFEAGIDLGQQVLARNARIIGPGAHRPHALGGDHHLIARHPQIAQRCARNCSLCPAE